MDQRRTTRTGGLWPAVLATALVLAFALPMLWEHWQQRQWAALSPSVEGSSPGPGQSRTFMGPGWNSDVLLQRPGDEELTEEPAGLPPLSPGERQMGIRRRVGAMIEEVVLWTTPLEGSEVLDFYTRAAQELGFVPVMGRRWGPPPGWAGPQGDSSSYLSQAEGEGGPARVRAAMLRHSRTLVRPRQPGQYAAPVLTVRQWPLESGGSRVVVVYRYPEDNSFRSIDSAETSSTTY